MEPTEAQISYAKDLMAKLGYTEDDLEVDFEYMTRAEVSELINELREEYGE